MDKDRCSRPLSSDLQYFDLRLSNPSPDSSQVQTYPRENWREPNMTSQYSSNSSSYPHHPSSWLPSSSSTSNSSYGRETRFPRPNSGRSSYLAPPLAPYVAPFHEQPLHSDDRHPTLRVDGHSSAFSQHPPPKHGVTAAEGGSHSLSPLRSASRSYSYENTSYSPRTREVYSSSQTPTMMQFSKLTANEQEEITAGLPPPRIWKSALKVSNQSWSLHLSPKGRHLEKRSLIPLPTLQNSQYSMFQRRSVHVVVEQNHALCLNPPNNLKILIFRTNRGALLIRRQSPRVANIRCRATSLVTQRDLLLLLKTCIVKRLTCLRRAEGERRKSERERL